MLAVLGEASVLGGLGDVVSHDGGNTAFTGAFSLFVDFDGMLLEVVTGSDVLDGRTIEFVSIGREALSGNRVAFRAHFTDFTEGIYIATIPEPSTALLVGFALVGLRLGRGFRRRLGT